MKSSILKDTGKILHNRFVLYFVLFLALSDLLFLAMGSEFVSISIFILSGFVTSFFSKNMMVIMCVAMVITNILRYGTGIRMSEGLVSGEMPPTTDEEETPDSKTTDEDTPPDSKPMDSKTPEIKTPEIKTPETKTPETKTPETKTPDSKTPVKDKVITEEDKQKFLENMEKLEMYEPLFKSMDKLMHKVGVLIGNVK
jgi:outer membrane biosynthesis protein TonB